MVARIRLRNYRTSIPDSKPRSRGRLVEPVRWGSTAPRFMDNHMIYVGPEVSGAFSIKFWQAQEIYFCGIPYFCFCQENDQREHQEIDIELSQTKSWILI